MVSIMPRGRAFRTVIGLGGLAAEMLIALAWWWAPEHAVVWAIVAASILVIAAIVDHGARR
jgi:hypothetical protein